MSEIVATFYLFNWSVIECLFKCPFLFFYDLWLIFLYYNIDVTLLCRVLFEGMQVYIYK